MWEVTFTFSGGGKFTVECKTAGNCSLFGKLKQAYMEAENAAEFSGQWVTEINIKVKG